MQNHKGQQFMESCESESLLFDDSPHMVGDSRSMSRSITIACDACLYEASNGRLYSSQDPHTCRGEAPQPQIPAYVPTPWAHNPWGDDSDLECDSVVETLRVCSTQESPAATHHTPAPGEKRQRDEEEEEPTILRNGLAIEGAMAKVMAELGRMCRATVYEEKALLEMIGAKTLPNKAFHTILLIRAGGRAHYAHAHFDGEGTFTAQSPGQILCEHFEEYAKKVASMMGGVLGTTISVRVFCLRGWSGESAVSSINHLAHSLGSCLAFTLGSILATDARQHQDEEDWKAWVQDVVFQDALPDDDAEGNKWRLVRVVRAVSNSIMEHVSGEDAEYVRDCLRKAVGDIEEILYDRCEESMFNEAPPELLVTKQWVATLCSKIPLDSPAVEDNIPDYKMAWYKMMANTDSTIYFEF